MTTPRVFIIRHGETEWSINGRHTGTTELELTANGEKRIIATGETLVGEGKLIDPKNLAHIYVSPRARARRTLELLDIRTASALPWKEERRYSDDDVQTNATIEVTEDIREWTYGEYEGMTPSAIRQHRKENGQGDWLIWHDGCPGGESPKDINDRLDRFIQDLRSRFQEPVIGKPKGEAPPGDVLVVAHGHILRALGARWIGRDVQENPSFILEAGGVGVLSYEHHNIKEPAVVLGCTF